MNYAIYYTLTLCHLRINLEIEKCDVVKNVNVFLVNILGYKNERGKLIIITEGEDLNADSLCHKLMAQRRSSVR